MKNKMLPAILLALCSHAFADTLVGYALKPDSADLTAQSAGYGRNSLVPLNKRYDQLSPDQLKYFRSQYDKLPDADEPPFPAAGLKKIVQQANQLQQGGNVNAGVLALAVHVDGHGVPEKVSVYETPDKDLANAMTFVLLNTKFKAAKCAGQPCAMDFPLRLEFKNSL